MRQTYKAQTNHYIMRVIEKIAQCAISGNKKDIAYWLAECWAYLSPWVDNLSWIALMGAAVYPIAKAEGREAP